MELSPDNIEELAKVLTLDTSCQSDVFQLKSDLSSVDVDRVISEAQDSLLTTSMEAIASPNAPCSFNDILDDICKMDKNIELQQAASNKASVDPIQQQIPVEIPPVFYHMPDLDMQPNDYTPECSFSNHPDFLQPLGQWSEYLPMPPSALSTIQDIPQLAPIPSNKPLTPPPEPVEIPQTTYIKTSIASHKQNSCYIKDKKEPIITMPPLQSYQYTIPPSMLNSYQMQQTEMSNTNLQFVPAPETNINFMLLPEQSTAVQSEIHPVQKQQQFFDWARVIPRRTFIQPSEIIVLRPLRTRKVISSRQTFDMASYFDTSSITIPMIRQRPRPRNQRRKQKLYTIPRADNLMFDFQLETVIDNNNNNNSHQNIEEQLYPENEIPELDEIFKRKRRTLNTRRNIPQQEAFIKSPSPIVPTTDIPKENPEKVAPPISQELEETYSDVDSDDAPLTVIKSMKCSNCRKLFKTCRSLAIHSKRCKVVPQSPELNKGILSKDAAKINKSLRKVETDQKPLIGSPKEEIKLKTESNMGRPLTRSQTRSVLKRKLVENPDDEVCAQKLSK